MSLARRYNRARTKNLGQNDEIAESKQTEKEGRMREIREKESGIKRSFFAPTNQSH